MELPKYIALPLWIKERKKISERYSKMNDEELKELTLKEIRWNKGRQIAFIVAVIVTLFVGLIWGFYTGKLFYDNENRNYEAFDLASEELCKTKYNESKVMGYWGVDENLLIFCEENYFTLKSGGET